MHKWAAITTSLVLVTTAAACSGHAKREQTSKRGKSEWPYSVYSIHTDGSDLRNLGVAGSAFARGPGRALAFILGRPPYEHGTRLAVMNDDGSHLRVLAAADQGWDTPLPPAWSPDGRTIAVTDCADRGIPQFDPLEGACISRISLVNAKTGIRIRRIPNVERPTWSPDGSRLAFQTLYVNPPCGSCPEAPSYVFVSRSDGRAIRRLVRGQFPSFSPIANVIAYRDRHKFLRLIRSDGTRLHESPRLLQWNLPGWSPDGTRSVVTIPCKDGLNECLGVMRISTGHVTPISRSGDFFGDGTGFAWSPDASKIAWSAFDDRANANRLYVAASSGTEKPREIFHTRRRFRIDPSSLVFTADGKRLIFTVDGGGAI